MQKRRQSAEQNFRDVLAECGVELSKTLHAKIGESLTKVKLFRDIVEQVAERSLAVKTKADVHKLSEEQRLLEREQEKVA